ncbi:hypothetical protein GIY56_06465 [Paracoccus sp. YIM 132242]|uniref:Uncharacterized protein n=1 Tax=Paracoccus lichenicola TaxID=2665644 RepID=A0A6L6HP07_9RHOB|nr:hypothetical protein [Paracoccus lichenicola]MTD99922.1 hypothetical protein [Paracoccus lichenicola]
MPKKATIQYREFKANGALRGMDLKAVLVDVLRRRTDAHRIGENARLRAIDLDGDGSHVVLNKVSSPETWDGPVFCGQIIHVKAGADIQAVLQSLDDDTDEFLVQNIDMGRGARIVKGVLYFAVNRNHVGLIESTAVRGVVLERYIAALLRQAGELDPDDRIVLAGKFLASGEKGLSEFSDLTLTARPSHRAKAMAGDRLFDRQAAEVRDEGATVLDVLRLMGWRDEALARLEAEVPEGGRVEGLLKVFIKDRRHKLRIPRAAIDEALRNVDPADLGLHGDGREQGGMVKLSVVKEIATEGSLLDPADAMVKIIEALREWAAAGKIDCRFDGSDLPP